MLQLARGRAPRIRRAAISSRPPSDGRLKTVDGLRGIAALAVVLYHMRSEPFSTSVWPALDEALHHGLLGVDVFFVLSGFVIAYSVRATTHTLGFLGRFAVKRFVRLDPPYWAAIALELAILGLVTRNSNEWPSPGKIVSHGVYLQNVLGYGDLIPIFWTLCFEVQFYLFFVGLLVVGQAVRQRGFEKRWVAILVLGGLYVISVLWRYRVVSLGIPALALALIRWFQFFLGVLVWWVVSARLSPRYLLAAWAFLAIVIVATGASWLQFLTIAVSGLLWWSYRRDQMASVLSARPLQFLGTISYSLYLFHPTIGWGVVRAPKMLLGVTPSTVGVWAVYVTAVLASCGFAWVAWWALERPCQRWSRTLFASARQTG